MEEITDREIIEIWKKFARSQQSDFVLHNRNLFYFRRNLIEGHVYARLKIDESIQFDFRYNDLLKLLNLEV